MKKVLMVVAVAVMFCSIAFADVKEGRRLYDEKKYAESAAEYQRVLPTLKGAEKFRAQWMIGNAKYHANQYDEAIVEFKKVAGIEGVDPFHLSSSQLHIGHSLWHQKKYDDALVEYRKVAGIDGADPGDVSGAQRMIGYITKNKAEYVKVLEIKGAHITYLVEALNATGVTDDLADVIVARVKEQSEKNRPALLKKIAENSAVSRAVIKAVPDDVTVVSELYSAAKLREVSYKEQATILTDIWDANREKIREDVNARALIEGVLDNLYQLIGEVGSVVEARRRIAEMK